MQNLRTRPYWCAEALVICYQRKQTDNRICLNMHAGCWSQFSLQMRWFVPIPDRKGTSVFLFLATIAIRIQTSPLGWSSLFSCPKCCLCCELTVSSLNLILGHLFFWPWFLKSCWEGCFSSYMSGICWLSTWVLEVLICPVVHAEVWCWEFWLRLYPVAGDASWWTRVGGVGERLFSVWGQLCLGSLLFIIITMKAKVFFCVCTHGYYCTTLPNLSLAPLWPALNCCLPIFSSSPPSTHCWVFFHLALCISPLPSLVPPRGSLALQECLHSSSPLINSLLSQSHLILFAHFPFLLHLLPFLPNLTSI